MLSQIKFLNCRLLADLTLPLEKRTVVLGNNGTGKSTVIEALRLLSIGKSFRTSRLDEMISFDRPYFRLTTKREDHQQEIVDFFYGQAFSENPVRERALNVNGKTLSFLDWVGRLPSVLFVPSDIEVVIGMPQVRRKYIDGVLWQVDAEFREQFLDLNRVLRERAALLFSIKIHRAGLDELQPWSELLVKLSQSIRSKRLAYTDYIKERLTSSTFQTKTKLQFQIQYQVTVEDITSVQDQEIKLAQNLYGPHRDEIEIVLNDRSARKFASRGQARTAVVLLKVIETQYLADRLEKPPIILLDDVFSELDQENSQFLFSHLSDQSQIVATSIENNSLLTGWSVIQL